LEAAGCERVFTEHASGTLARRPQLEAALSYLRSGDTLVITKLDRLGRSVKNLKEVADDLQSRGIGLRALSQGIDTTTSGGRLFFHMLAAIAEFEHDLIVERTQDGLAAARARGRKGGRKSKMTPTRITEARRMYDSGVYTVEQIAQTFGVTRPTIYRHLEEPKATAVVQ
jgi:DNA invertase Pin-like site-specific DNA recombinase